MHLRFTLLALLGLSGCSDKAPDGADGTLPSTGDGGADGGTTGDAGTDSGGEPGVIAISGGQEVIADGRSALMLTLAVTDADGGPAAAGRELGLSTSLGALGDPVWTADGVATLTFTAGTWPGDATFAADEGWLLTGDTSLSLVDGPGVGTQLHTHGSLSEGSGTYLSGTRLLEELGVDAIWWTDHDYRYNPDGYHEVGGMAHEAKVLPVYDGVNPGWVTFLDSLETAILEHNVAAAHDGDLGLRLSIQARATATAATPEVAVFEYKIPERTNYKTLMGEQTLRLQVRPWEVDADAELFVQVPLSRMNGDMAEKDYRSIVLVHSAKTYESDDLTVYVPMDLVEGEWNEVEVDLSNVAREHFPDIGVDLHAEFITLYAQGWAGARATWHLDTFEFEQEIDGEELRALQYAYLDDIAESVTQLVGMEMSHVTDAHANAFFPTREWSFLPYVAPDELLLSDAVAQVESEGGVVSWNHVFGTTSVLYTEEERQEMVSEIIADLAETDLHGCDLLEVGYRTRGGDLDDFSAVWDGLGTLHGITVTGLGTSDQHHLSLGNAGNNFISWIGSASDDPLDLVWNLKRGMVWFGDPEAFADANVQVSLRAPAAQAVMGQVVVGAEGPQQVEFAASPLEAGWSVRAVIDGEDGDEWTVAKTGGFSTSVEVDPATARVVRFVVAATSGADVLFTNPIYFLPAGTEVDAERLPAP